jgi:spore germination protein GerM
MTKTKWLVLAGLVIVLSVLILIFFRGGDGEKAGPGTEPASPKAPSTPQETAGTRKITLFFLSEDDDFLHSEEREVPAGPSLTDDLETAVVELIKGSAKDLVPPFPPETGVRQIFVTKDGTAYVDLTKEVTENFAYGSSSEMSAVYALVDTLTFNFKDIKKVSLLIEGGERETLGGHIDLSRPLSPQYSLIVK